MIKYMVGGLVIAVIFMDVAILSYLFNLYGLEHVLIKVGENSQFIMSLHCLLLCLCLTLGKAQEPRRASVSINAQRMVPMLNEVMQKVDSNYSNFMKRLDASHQDLGQLHIAAKTEFHKHNKIIDSLKKEVKSRGEGQKRENGRIMNRICDLHQSIFEMDVSMQTMQNEIDEIKVANSMQNETDEIKVANSMQNEIDDIQTLEKVPIIEINESESNNCQLVQLNGADEVDNVCPPINEPTTLSTADKGVYQSFDEVDEAMGKKKNLSKLPAWPPTNAAKGHLWDWNVFEDHIALIRAYAKQYYRTNPDLFDICYIDGNPPDTIIGKWLDAKIHTDLFLTLSEGTRSILKPHATSINESGRKMLIQLRNLIRPTGDALQEVLEKEVSQPEPKGISDLAAGDFANWLQQANMLVEPLTDTRKMRALKLLTYNSSGAITRSWDYWLQDAKKYNTPKRETIDAVEKMIHHEIEQFNLRKGIKAKTTQDDLQKKKKKEAAERERQVNLVQQQGGKVGDGKKQKKPCYYHFFGQRGCTKGDQCTHLHSMVTA